VEAIKGSNDELGLVMDDNLVLILLGNLFPVTLHGVHLRGLGDSGDLGSEHGNLWDLVHGVVLHFSELHVLLVELEPELIVDINDGSLGWLFTGELDVSFGVLLELHVGNLDLLHLLIVQFHELLHLSGWSLLIHLMDILDKTVELWGLGESLGLLLELLSM